MGAPFLFPLCPPSNNGSSLAYSQTTFQYGHTCLQYEDQGYISEAALDAMSFPGLLAAVYDGSRPAPYVM